MILYLEFLRECEEYHKLLEMYGVKSLDIIADMYLKENDAEYTNRRKLEYPYSTVATMNSWLV